MCGITGIVSRNSSVDVKNALVSLNNTIKHRGPDDEGFAFFQNEKDFTCYGDSTPKEVIASSLNFAPKKHVNEFVEETNLGIAHRRLSILDLSPGGHQPMSTTDAKLWITFNGEIYNYAELKHALEKDGFVFITNSDTEVILNLYRKYGKQCLDYLDGMWSFVIYDKEKNILFGARDRFGVKPFYYYFMDGVFAFASEPKALKALPFLKTSLNEKAVFDFFAYTEMEQNPQGLFQNILELFPSEYFEFNLGKFELKIEKYYSLEINSGYEDFNEEKYDVAIEKTKDLLVNAVKTRMHADVAVGSCLSGGIDSSAIVGIMNNIRSNSSDKINLFTASFPGQPMDETNWAKIVAEKTNSNWYCTTPNSSGLVKDLDDLIYCQDSPLWSTSTYAQYSVMRLVNEKGIKVVLDGQGGDELYAGYLPYLYSYWKELFKRKKYKTLIHELNTYSGITHSLMFLTKESLKQLINQKGNNVLGKINSSDKDFLTRDFVKAHETKRNQSERNLNDRLKNDFVNGRLKTYLKCEDRCAMRFSVESRTPFADDRALIENGFSMPSNYKIRNGLLKSILRDSVEEFLPRSIYTRNDKKGYQTPNDLWISSLGENWRDLIDFNTLPFIQKTKIEKAFDQLLKNSDHLHKNPSSQETVILFKTLAFSAFQRVFSI